VQEGMRDPRARMFNKSYNLGDAQLFDAEGKTATLPTETWREYIERRDRYHDLHGKLGRGEVQNPEDLITLNLDIRQFAQDVLDNAETADLVRAYWKAIKNISVLDPTCGSGAFLFAALNILQPLYQSALQKTREFVREADELEQPKKYPDFRETLAEIGLHPNEKYFVLKSIIVNNLYGVDIMEEAVEIAKLRLFLKLMSEVERADQIEPLPDVDFNIRAGNTLVGYATEAELHTAMNAGLELGDTAEKKKMIHDRLEDIAAKFELFRGQQTKHGGEITPANKKVLRDELTALNEELNLYLADQYTPELSKKPQEYQKWKVSHKPFHWFVDFHGIMKNGGFSAVIGNPPWMEYSSAKKSYTLIDYKTLKSGNLHSITTERVLKIVKKNSFVSFIVQLPLTNSSRMDSIRKLISNSSDFVWISTFDDRPGKLFEGLQHCRSSIFVLKLGGKSKIFTTKYHRWNSDARENLVRLVNYAELKGKRVFQGHFPKYSTSMTVSIFEKLSNDLVKTIEAISAVSVSENFIFYQEATQYWVKAIHEIPFYQRNSIQSAPSHGRYLYFQNPETPKAISSLLNSSLFYIYFIAYSDCFHLSDTIVANFPTKINLESDKSLIKLGDELLKSLKSNSESKTIETRDGEIIDYAEFFTSKSKPIIDQIDQILAQHYGFTDEELDFIINYDIKYRMGRDAANDAEEA
jgi:hypothetical protein